MIVGGQVVPAVPGAVAERQPAEQGFAAIKALAKRGDIGFAAQSDPKLLSDAAAAPVASDQISATYFFSLSIGPAHGCRYPRPVLGEFEKLRAVSDLDCGQPLGERL